MADVCKNIDNLLKERGISGVKMSADLGMSRSFMTELRKGRAKSVKIETAQKIADYFGVTTDYLLGKTDDSAPVSQKEKAPAQGGEPIGPNKRALLDLVENMSEEEMAAVLELVKAAKKMWGREK